MSDTPNASEESLTSNVPLPMGSVAALRENWGWLLALGIALMVLGVFALGAAWLVTEVWILLFGILLIIGGVFQVAQSFTARAWRGFLWHVLAGVLYLVVGAMLLAHPLLGAAAVTLVLAVAFLVDGLLKIVLSLQVRDHPNWGWLLLDGVVLVVLALLILGQWPAASAFIIGLLIGIQMIFTGAGFTALALAARNAR